jgi:hypothetical protein
MAQQQVGKAGSGIVSAGRVRMADELVRVGLPREEAVRSEPKVQFVREDGVIRAIDVTCACGQRIRIRCDYE